MCSHIEGNIYDGSESEYSICLALIGSMVHRVFPFPGEHLWSIYIINDTNYIFVLILLLQIVFDNMYTQDRLNNIIGPRENQCTGVLPRGRSRGAHPARAPPKIEKKCVKSWFFTRNTPNIFAPPSVRRNFFKCVPPNLKSWIRPCYLHNLSQE